MMYLLSKSSAETRDFNVGPTTGNMVDQRDDGEDVSALQHSRGGRWSEGGAANPSS